MKKLKQHTCCFCAFHNIFVLGKPKTINRVGKTNSIFMKKILFTILAFTIALLQVNAHTAIVACLKMNPNNCFDVILSGNLDCDALIDGNNNNPNSDYNIVACWHPANPIVGGNNEYALESGDGYEIVSTSNGVFFKNTITNQIYPLITSIIIDAMDPNYAKFLDVQDDIIIIFNSTNPFIENRNVSQPRPEMEMLSLKTLKEKTSLQAQLFPNPTIGEFYLQLDSPESEGEVFTIQIFDITGREVMSGITYLGTNQYNVDALNEGTYIYTINSSVKGRITSGYVILQ